MLTTPGIQRLLNMMCDQTTLHSLPFKIGLYVNDITWTEDTIRGQLVEAVWTGYVQATLLLGPHALLAPSGLTVSPQLTVFFYNRTADNQRVAGWFWYHTEGNVFMGGNPFFPYAIVPPTLDGFPLTYFQMPLEMVAAQF